jgi:general secretion pathway protein A
MDYLEFFHLHEDPFGLTPDSSYFYPSKMHNDILASLDYAVDQKEGFSLVIGEPGTGKTTILKIFIDRWKDTAEIALVMTPRLSPEELLHAVLDDLNIQLRAMNKNDMLKAFRDFLIERSLEGKRVIIIVDEAQNLSDSSLEELRLLSNLETEKEKLLQIILVGQPEFQRRLQSDGLRQLNQRISIRATLRPLTLQETSDYIAFRIIKAGKGSAMISENVKNNIFKISQGTPRLVNLITSRAMMAAYVCNSYQIEKKHVVDAVKHVLDMPSKTTIGHRMTRYAITGLFLSILFVFLIFIYDKSFHILHSPQIAANPRANASTLKISVQPAAGNISKSAIVTVDTANLRKRPSLQANVEQIVSRGEILEIMDEWTERSGYKWYKIRTRDGKESWIAAYIVRMSSLDKLR